MVEALLEGTMETNCTFSDDILEEILCILPVRQLLRIRCVCKLWCAIVDNPIFINKHHLKQYAILKQEADIPLLFSGGHFIDDAPAIKFLSKRYGDDPLFLTPDLQRDRAKKSKLLGGLSFAGCINGVVLLRCEMGSPHLALWNPATREFKVVLYPCPILDSEEYCTGPSELGFDPKSNDLKIITTVCHAHNDKHYWWEMYSLNTDSWKTIEDPCSCPTHDLLGQYLSGSDLYINSKRYWWNMGEHENLIISFDFYNEVFQVFDQPRMEGYDIWSICNYNGSLALIAKNLEVLYYPETSPQPWVDNGRLEIWVIEKIDDLGIPSLWKHLFTVGPFEGYGVHFCSFRVGSDILITLVDEDLQDESWLYDPATKKITKKFEFQIYCCSEYVESLFQLS